MDERLEEYEQLWSEGYMKFVPDLLEYARNLENTVQELEEVIHLYKLRKENAQELNEIVIKPLKEENQRYKEALEFYADEENNHHKISFTVGEWEAMSPVCKDGGLKARRALRGEST